MEQVSEESRNINWNATTLFDKEAKLEKVTQDCAQIKELKDLGIPLSEQAINVINNSQILPEMGRIVFLDRYSYNYTGENLHVGDLVITVTQDHPKWPKKDLGIVQELLPAGQVKLHMISGIHAQEENKEFTVKAMTCEKPKESILDAYERVANAIASVESDKEQFKKVFLETLMKGYLQPAGRIMTGAHVDENNDYVGNLTLYNCYVIPSPKDSREGIIQESLSQMVEIMSRGGGVGINLSTLRPKYAHVYGVNGRSSGAVSWGGIFSHATGLIEQGGSRRGALMLMLCDWHPDCMDFIRSKRVAGILENANISVLVSNDFMQAVKDDSVWTFEYPDLADTKTKETYKTQWDGDLQAWKEKGRRVKVFDTIKARDMWHELVSSAWASAEPGIVFLDRYNDASNSHYFNRIICTNPCGEQGLPGWGVCNLGHLPLQNFVVQTGEDALGPTYEVNWDDLQKAIHVGTRFLDNVIDRTPYIFEENKKNQLGERRVGLGTLGLAEMMIKLRIKYGSDESVPFIDKLYKFIATNSVQESINLAKEKGKFPMCDNDKILESGFMKGLPDLLRDQIREHGIRNVTLTTQAPTGTVGTMLGTSTGVEPFYALEYYQQSRLGFHKVELDICKAYTKNEEGKLPDFFVTAMELTPKEHVKMQGAIQRWTDSSISKTANAPENFSVEETKELYEYAFDLGCKGMTIYRDNSRSQQVLTTDAGTEEKNKTTGATTETKEEQKEVIYGPELGNLCPQCKDGTMVKIGGCTECSNQCGFKGGCDLK